MSTPVIECVEVSKAYSKRVTALKNLTLNVYEGMSFGLLGENGAGKSTLVRLILGFIFPTSGRVRVPLAIEALAALGHPVTYLGPAAIAAKVFGGLS